MVKKPTYEELKQRNRELEKEKNVSKEIDPHLKDPESVYRLMLENISDTIILTDDKGNMVYVCPNAMVIFGLSQDEILSHQTVQRFMNGTICNISDLKKQKEIKNIEWSITDSYGQTRFLLISAKSVSINGGTILYVMRDITERQEYEEKLKKYKNIVSSTMDGISFLDENYRYIIVNDAYKRFSGIDRDQFIGLTVSEYLGDDVFGKFIKPYIDRCLQGEVINYQEMFEYPKLGKRFVDITYSPYRDSSNRITGVIANTRDITDRKRMEEELLRSKKLEAIGILAGGIAHDFNNILTTILGNVSMARIQTRPEEEIFDLLSEAEKALKMAEILAKQLLTFAKGGTPVKETALIEEVIKESSFFVLRGSKTNCKFSIPEDLFPVEIDVGQISQVINNIVINANQAMPEGGIIQVAAENLIIENRHGLPVKPGRYIKITITDQGVGILEKHLLNIFDPYFSTKHEGSGLGLATAYSIIRKHNGHITVESGLGVGTTFHIYLPASDKAISKKPYKEEVKLIKGQGRILVMDDEEPLRKMIGRMLGNLGYESELAKDGAEAIESYKKAIESGNPYDAVILDLTVPGGMGGKEAIKKLLTIDPEVKAIVSSGYYDDPVLANFQEYGFKGMMPKPFKSLSLGKELHEVLKGEKE